MFKKATSVVLGVMILVSPLTVSALSPLPDVPANASIEQLQQIVAQLTQMLQQLLEQIANNGSNDKPKLTVSATPASQTQIPGAVGVTLANFHFDATTVVEDLRVPGISVTYVDDMSADPTTCQIFDGATALTQGDRVINPNNGTYQGAQSYSFWFNTSIVVPRGTIRTLALKCSIPSGATSGAFSFGLMSGTAINVTGITSGKTIAPVVTTNAGPLMSVARGGNGALTVALDASSPMSQIVSAGSIGNTVGAFRLSASGEAVTVDRMAFVVDDYNFSPSDTTQFTFWNGSTQIGSSVVTPNDARPTGYTREVTFTSPVRIEPGTFKVITVKADLTQIGTAQPGAAGHRVQFCTLKARGTGASSGLTVMSAESQNCSQGVIYMYRSFPAISKMSLPSTTLVNGSNDVLRFSITALGGTSSYGLQIGKMTLKPSFTNVNVNAIDLYAYSDAAFSMPAAGLAAGGHLGGVSQVTSGQTVALDLVSLGRVLNVLPGQTVYVRAIAGVSNVQQSSSLATALAYDDNYGDIGTFAEQQHHAFVWSGNSVTTSSAQARDWSNSYLVPGLSNTSQAMSGSGTVTPTPTTATYRGYLDGALFITTNNVAESYALENCKLNAANNPTKSIRCTWGDKEIYNAAATGSGSTAFSASPQSGQAPLNVTFSGTARTGGYTIDFGDGSPSVSVGCRHGGCPSINASPIQIDTTHTYTAAGTYTAKLSSHFYDNQANCVGVDCAVVARATVTVSEGSAIPAPTCSISYFPTTITPGQTLMVSWAGTADATRTYTLTRNGVKYFTSGTIASSGNASAKYEELGGPGTITRTDTVRNAGGSATCTTSVVVAGNDRIVSPNALTAGQGITSPSGVFKAYYQTDGHFVIYQNGAAGWATGRYGYAPGRAVMQSDGNFVNYDASGSAYWSTGTAGRGTAPYSLVLQDDGNLVIYDANNAVIWSAAHGIASAATPSQQNLSGLANALAALEAALKAFLGR